MIFVLKVKHLKASYFGQISEELKELPSVVMRLFSFSREEKIDKYIIEIEGKMQEINVHVFIWMS